MTSDQHDPLETLPEDNSAYKKQEYWDQRFEHEERYEWLVSHGDVKGLLAEYLPQEQQDHQQQDYRVLVVGCGNSSFSSDLVRWFDRANDPWIDRF